MTIVSRGRTTRMCRGLAGAIAALVVAVAFPRVALALDADVERGVSHSLIADPVLRNYPPFLAGVGLAPFPEDRGPFLKGAGPQGKTTVKIDLERGRVVVSQTKDGVDLVWPWVADMHAYLGEQKRFVERDLLYGGAGGKRLVVGDQGAGHFNIDLPVRFPRTLSRIIGQGANIQVSGSESITFSGETQYFIKDRDNESGGQRRFPELDMRQQLQINLTGTIGEKVKVEVQHNSESQVPLENRIKLRYEGFEDEVIQRIEVGNTNLSLPGNQFVSFSAQQQGLFGVKAEGKAGKLDFTAILSQQQGRTDRETYTGSSREDSVVINDMDFVKNRYFVVNDYDSIIDIRVFVDDDNVTNNDGSQVQARAYIGADSTQPTPQTGTFGGWFDEMEEATDYYVNREIGILVMNKILPENYTLAVWCSTAVGSVGEVPLNATQDSSLVARLKLIKPPAEFYKPTDAQFGSTWYYQLRNVYDLRARNILPDGFQLKIYRKAAGAEERFDNQNGTPFLQVMGLDLEGAVPGEPPDDQIDIEYRGEGNLLFPSKKGIPPGGFLPYRPTIMVDYEAGLLYFPDLRPFDPAYNHQLPNVPADSLLETNPVIYDNHDPKATDSKFEIEVKYRTSQASFSLNRSNILEGSEVVKLNGRTLTRGVDYRIIYEIGQIEFLTDEAQDPEAKITVDFEYAPFLSQAQKSLAGAAGTYHLSDKTKISSIWLYKGKKTPYRRPRLGQEPSRIVVGGLSLSTEREPEFLTRWTDKIPGVTAREKSRFRVDLEAAATFPNPNTKNAVYIDDMEGTEESSSFGVTRRQWDFMSIPGGRESPEYDWQKRYRNVWWYNPKNSTTRGDLNPTLSQEERTKFVPVLEVSLRDGTVVDGGGRDGWGGVMRLVSKTGLDLKERKFFEIWINDFDLNRGKLNIDMGLLGEDAMWSKDQPNGLLDTEDRNLDGVLDDTGTKGPTDEDTGLDRLFDADEPGDGSDPAGDNWAYDEKRPDDYSHINGTEDNGFLDTEDLNGNGYIDGEKAYFRFTLDLASDEYVAATGNQEGPGKNWKLYRIPLAKATGRQIQSEPTFDKGVKYVRLFFTDLDTTAARFQIYSIEVTGNRWLEAGIQDTTGALIDTAFADRSEIFAAGVINNKDGEAYDPPPVEIISERDVSEKEQSLVLNYENLAPGHTGTVFRALFDDEDYTRYDNIEFWVKRAEPSHDFEPYPHFFYRFGGDSLNFYEVSTDLDSATGTDWQRIVLDLARLTQVKLSEPDTVSLYGRKLEARRDTLVENTARGPKTYVFSAVGRPSMTKIRRLTFGVENRSREDPLTGVVWVDDLRLLNVKGDPGAAARVGVDLALSDFINVSTDYRKVGKEFRHITGGGGENAEENPRHGSDETELNVTGSVRLGQFLDPVGVSMPVTVGYSKSTSLPELATGSDIVLEDPSSEKTERKSESASTTIARSRKSKSPWLYYTIDAMSLRLGGRRNSNVNPTKIDSTWGYNVDWSYNYQPRFQSGLKVFRSWEVNPLPTSLSMSASRERTENRSLDVRSDVKKVVQGRKSNSSWGFAMVPLKSETFSSDFSFSSNRDHLYGKPLSFLASVNRGLETQRNHQTKLSYSPKFISMLDWFKPRFNYNTKYLENMPVAQRRIELDADTGDTLSVTTLHNVQNQNTASVDFGIGVARIFQLLPGPKKPEPGDSAASASRYGPMTVVHAVRNAGSRIGDVSAAVSYGRDSRYDRLLGRPGLKYQFGFTDKVDSLLQERTPGQTVTDNRSRDVSARASSSVRLIPAMSLRVSYNTSWRKSNQSRNQKESRTTTWPDLTYTWDGIDEIWRLEDYLKSASVDVGYNKRTESSGKTLDDIETERVSIRWDPLFSLDMEWGNGLRSSISTDRSREISRNFRGGTSEKVSTTSGINASFSYKMSSRKQVNIPILGKGTKGGSFTATTNFSLDFRYDTSKEEQVRPYRLDGHTRSISIRPRVTWTWLQNLSGSLELQFGERRNLKNENRSTRTIGASISALFKF